MTSGNGVWCHRDQMAVESLLWCSSPWSPFPLVSTMLKGKTQIKFVCVYPWRRTVASFSKSVSTHMCIKMRSWKESWREKEEGKEAVNPPQRQCLCICVKWGGCWKCWRLRHWSIPISTFPVKSTHNRTPWATCTQGWLGKFILFPSHHQYCVSLPPMKTPPQSRHKKPNGNHYQRPVLPSKVFLAPMYLSSPKLWHNQ